MCTCLSVVPSPPVVTVVILYVLIVGVAPPPPEGDVEVVERAKVQEAVEGAGDPHRPRNGHVAGAVI